MRDVVYVAITLGFFGLAAAFVIGCARIVGPDDPSLSRGDQPDDDVPATSTSGVTT